MEMKGANIGSEADFGTGLFNSAFSFTDLCRLRTNRLRGSAFDH